MSQSGLQVSEIAPGMLNFGEKKDWGVAPEAARAIMARFCRLWAYVKDERPFNDPSPPAARYLYSPDRKGAHPQRHLKEYRGVLHADSYAGFKELDRNGSVREAACRAHVRRTFFEAAQAGHAPIATEAVQFIAGIYAIEKAPRGGSPDERKAVRQEQAVPKLTALKAWCEASQRRKNGLFTGSDAGGERAADVLSLVETARLNGLDPERYLREVLTMIADHPFNRIGELLPWNLERKAV